MDLIEKSESRQIESPVVIETSDEVINLRKQIEILENDLDQANSTIQQLKNKPGKKVTKSTTTTSSTQTETYHEKNLKHKQEIDSLSSELDSVRKENELANERIQNILNETKLSENLLKQTNQDQEKQIDSLQLELKQMQQSINQEKLIQIKEHNEERQEIDNLKQENQDLVLSPGTKAFLNKYRRESQTLPYADSFFSDSNINKSGKNSDTESKPGKVTNIVTNRRNSSANVENNQVSEIDTKRRSSTASFMNYHFLNQHDKSKISKKSDSDASLIGNSII